MSYGSCACGAGTDGGGDEISEDAGFAVPLDHRFVVSDWIFPTTLSDASAASVDVDGKAGDGADNQLAATLASLTSLGTSLRDELTARTDDGSFILLLNVQTETPPDTRSKVFVYTGSNPTPAACADIADTICRHHLDGSATFTATPTAEGTAALSGSLGNGAVDARSGTWELPFLVGDTQLVFPVELPRVILTMEGAILKSGRIGGALRTTWVQSTFVPALASFAESIVTRDCTMPTPPSCGCMSQSAGADLLAALDNSPEDCAISAAELLAAPGAWTPDIDLDGDGTADAMSFGFGFSGVAAQYTVP